MISIIGAGPAGNYLAYLLARAGKQVQVFEEHEQIGAPIQCTGLLTPALADFLDISDEYLVNRLQRIKVCAKQQSTIITLQKEELIVQRQWFDSYIAKKAEDAGAKYFRGHRFLDYAGGKMRIRHNGAVQDVPTDILVGADGPFSQVARSQGMLGDRKYYFGIQARMRYRGERDMYEVHFGDEFPEFFGWITPETGDIARIGLAVKGNKGMACFERFLRMKGLSKTDIIEYQSGVIPIHDPRLPVQQGNVYLLGDAAFQVKATTLGGIIPGMAAAEALADALLHGRDYRKGLATLNRQLRLHLKIRKMLDKFSDADYDRLIGLVGQPRVKRIIESESREFPLKMLVKLVLAEPRLLRFAGKLV